MLILKDFPSSCSFCSDNASDTESVGNVESFGIFMVVDGFRSDNEVSQWDSTDSVSRDEKFRTNFLSFSTTSHSLLSLKRR